MRRMLGLTVALVCTMAMLTGCGLSRSKQSFAVQTPAAPAPAAPAAPAVPSLPGSQADLQAALSEHSSVKYQVVSVDDLGGKDKDTYLDGLLTEHQWPEPSMFVIVIFTKDNFDARFAMGADFNANKVSVEEMLGLLRDKYMARVRQGDPSGGLADLIRAINQRMPR